MVYTDIIKVITEALLSSEYNNAVVGEIATPQEPKKEQKFFDVGASVNDLTSQLIGKPEDLQNTNIPTIVRKTAKDNLKNTGKPYSNNRK